VSALRDDLELVPDVFVSWMNSLLQGFDFAIQHAREREVVIRASRRQQVEILVVNVTEDQTARAIEASLHGLERALEREI